MSGASAGPLADLPEGAALLVSPVRRAVVETLAALPEDEREVGLTAAELGDELDLHSTTIRFHVDQLVAGGVLDAYFARSGGVGRPSKRYILRQVPMGQTAAEIGGEAPFGMLAGVLASALSTSELDPLTPEQAGIRWVQRRAEQRPPQATGDSAEDRVGQVVGLLDDWGYTLEPERAEDGAFDVTLRDCPFIDLARTHPDVVCGMHRGLFRGALDAVGERDARVSLQPFVGPGTCRARLTLRTENDDE